jgi:DNA-directed RNA polymerase specialized sigma24 family protein
MYVQNIESFAQRESLNEYQKKKGEVAALALSVPKRIIQREVIRLDDLRREAVIKFFWEKLDIPEIAYRMKLRPNSVQKLIESALSTIRQRLSSKEELSPA